MSANPRIYPDSYYAGEVVVVPASFLQALDTAQFKGVDGDAGGTWTPAAPIEIAGAGLWACCPWVFTASSVGGSTAVLFTPSAPAVFGDSDYFVLESGHAKAIRLVAAALEHAVDASFATGDSIPRVRPQTSTVSVVNNSDPATYKGDARIVCPLRVHDGATLDRVNFFFAVGAAHASVPPRLPLFRAFAVDASGNVTNLSTSTSQTGWSGNGFVAFPTPASGAAWYNSGNAQSFTYVCDAGTVIDASKYTYYVEIIDEGGTTPGSDVHPGNIFIGMQARYTAIADLRFQ